MFIPSIKDLPLLVHGKEGSGASLFSIKLVAALAKNGNPLTFWSAYPMAKEEFLKDLGGKLGVQIKIIEDENPEWLSAVLLEIDPNQILFVKNFEVVPDTIRKRILERKSLVIAGDMEKVMTENQILDFQTKIFFSSFPGISIPVLEKYQGYMSSKNKSGIVDISSLTSGGVGQ